MELTGDINRWSAAEFQRLEKQPAATLRRPGGR